MFIILVSVQNPHIDDTSILRTFLQGLKGLIV